MGRLTELTKANTKKPGGKCPVCRALREYDTADADELQELLDASSDVVTHSALTRALRADGRTVGDNAVTSHRSGACSGG